MTEQFTKSSSIQYKHLSDRQTSARHCPSPSRNPCPIVYPNSESTDDDIIGSLGIPPSVEQQRRTRRPPAIRVPDTPHRDTHTIPNRQARINHHHIIRGRRTSNIQFGDCTLRHDRTERLQCTRHPARVRKRTPGRQMRLRPDAVDRPTGDAPLLDVRDHAGRLGVAGAVDVVLVDVEFGGGVCGAGGLEREADVVLT